MPAIRGFTLIELLMVIAIIGLLASVVLASLTSARSKGSGAAAQQTMKSVQIAATICLGDLAAISLPSDTINGGGGAICTGNVATYPALPSGWIYCNGSAGTQSATDCGNEVSAQSTGISFSLVSENNTTGDIITCIQSTCTKTNESTPN